MAKLISHDSISDKDLEKIELTCGLEIHQQLNTGKLFCSCPCEIVPNETLNKQISRKLRFSQGESGEIDKAALEEFKKGKTNIYKYNDKIACLVDLDEEPPKDPNTKAVDTVLKVGKMFNLKFFDKIQFMRKLIIDGSITSGFQRTALLGMRGHFTLGKNKIMIEGVNLEEDSCRTIERKDKETIFALDRQGIPLIEITTGPQIKSPDEAYDAALYIGNVLRSFKETKRGLGTIRQDLNVSIPGGSRVEIKGTQNLKLIPDIIKNEMRRQKSHQSILEEVTERKINCENFTNWETYDITNTLKKSDSKVIKENLKEKDSAVIAVKLFNFKGILKHEMQKNYRFATEVSERNKKHFPTVKGLFHSDELPNYGITDDDIYNIREKLELNKDDSFILIANKKDIAIKSMQNVLQILSDLLVEVPEEVRQVDPKGTVTKFMRPMPGSARMYPETDVQDILIDKKEIDKLELPEMYNEKLDRIEKDWKIEKSKIEETLNKFSEDQITELIKLSGKSASGLYSIIFEIPKDIKKRDNVEPIDFKYELLKDLLTESKESNINSKTIRDIFLSLYKDKLSEVDSIKEYLEKNNLIKEQVDDKEVEKKIKEIVEKNPKAPFGALMGMCMKEFQGNVDGKIISEILRKLQ